MYGETWPLRLTVPEKQWATSLQRPGSTLGFSGTPGYFDTYCFELGACTKFDCNPTPLDTSCDSWRAFFWFYFNLYLGSNFPVWRSSHTCSVWICSHPWRELGTSGEPANSDVLSEQDCFWQHVQKFVGLWRRSSSHKGADSGPAAGLLPYLMWWPASWYLLHWDTFLWPDSCSAD